METAEQVIINILKNEKVNKISLLFKKGEIDFITKSFISERKDIKEAKNTININYKYDKINPKIIEVINQKVDQVVTIFIDKYKESYRLEYERELDINNYSDINKAIEEEDFQTLYIIKRKGKVCLIKRKMVVKLK